MKLDEITVKKDEYYTPAYAIAPILPYIPSGSVVWCPFDTEESLFVSILRGHGCVVTATHIDTGRDFFETAVDCDYIVSNPPYSLKNEVFERLFALNTPFAMLVGIVGLFESQHRFGLFKNHSFEILFLNKRVSFFEDYSEQKPKLNPPFSSAYITRDVLPDRLVFAEIDKKYLRPKGQANPGKAAEWEDRRMFKNTGCSSKLNATNHEYAEAAGRVMDGGR